MADVRICPTPGHNTYTSVGKLAFEIVLCFKNKEKEESEINLGILQLKRFLLFLRKPIFGGSRLLM